MASITAQRDLVITLKRETLLNLGLLSKLQPMPEELSRLVFKDNALEKPTQNVFNHLAYYLVSTIDPGASAALPWPLYDTATERAYRNRLSVLVSDYSAKGLVSPVMSSYLVNPGCYKVTFLIFQLTQLAVQRVLVTKMHKEHQKKLYSDMTAQYKTRKDEQFIDGIKKETDVMLSKFSNYLRKREMLEKVAAMFRKRITQMEEALAQSKAQEYVDKLIDDFLKQHSVSEEMKKELLRLKNVHEKSQVFDNWLTDLDDQINAMETEWDAKMSPFLSVCQKTVQNSETLIARHTGEADRRTFAVEYNPQTDQICTQELQTLVNSQQKYVLKNIVKEGRLNFPNLIRGFLICICHVLKNTEADSDMDIFNKYLDGGRRNYAEAVQAMKILMEKVMNAECRLSPPSEKLYLSVSLREFTVIPPLPDLSDLKMNREYHPQIPYEPFTPLNLIKHQFNLRRKVANNSFTKPLPKMSLITPFNHKINNNDFLKSFVSGHTSVYDQQNTTLNVSTISHVNKANETIAECTSGFTQQQIFRLLSTKKSTSSKKFKHKSVRPHLNVVKGGLFNESTSSNETFSLYRSQSSPNLFDDREKRSMARNRARKLSIMKEGSPSLLEVSGIAKLDRDSNHSTPQEQVPKKLADAKSLPVLCGKGTDPLNNTSGTSDLSTTERVDLNEDIYNSTLKDKPAVLVQLDSIENIKTQCVSTENIQTNRKSIENIQTVHKSENVQTARKSTENAQTPRKSIENIQTLRKSTENVQAARKSTENAQTLRKSIDNVQAERKSTELGVAEPKALTPQPMPHLIKKTSSIEKIINRFKKVRASVIPNDIIPSVEDPKEIKTIDEEKENINVTYKTVSVDVFTANRVLLPDLLSPNCNLLGQNTDNLDQLGFGSNEEVTKPRKPRESLGATLGVDHTFLDQFDLID